MWCFCVPVLKLCCLHLLLVSWKFKTVSVATAAETSRVFSDPHVMQVQRMFYPVITVYLVCARALAVPAESMLI
jgi:hypothetical protein